MGIEMYYLLYFFIIIVSFKENRNKLLEKILLLIFLLLSGISINGKDKITYGLLFDLYPSLSNLKYSFLNDDIAPIGFKILIALVKEINNNFNFFILMISLIGTIFYFKASNYIGKKFGINIWEMMIIYYPICYFSLNFSSYKQYLAAMIFFYSLKYLFEKKFIKYILLILLAYTFHKSAIILLIFLPIFYFEKFYIKIFITLVSGVVLEKIVLLKINPIYLSNEAGILGLILGLIYLLFGIIYFYKSKKNAENKNIFCIIFFYFILIVLFYGKTNFMYRFNLYFYCLFQFIFPIVLKKIRVKNIKKIYNIIFSVLGIIYLNINLSRKEIYIPYKVIFFHSYLESKDWNYEEVKKKYEFILKKSY